MATRPRHASETLPAFCRARVLVLGVGNILFGDDGFGPQAVAHLAENYELPDDVYAMDVGTGARKLLFTLTLGERLPEEIVILDAVDGGRGDRQVGEIPLEALPGSKADDFSLHQLPSSNLLRELQDERGVKVTVVACDVGAMPQVIQASLSPAAREGAITAARHLAERLGLRPAARVRPG